MATRTAGLARLGALAEVVGRYAGARNYADGLSTTQLSPYLRRRLVLEEEVLGFARTVGPFGRVEKFVQEVVWRTYWKEWLEARPSVWHAYLAQLRSHDDTLPQTDRDRLACALAGTTDLPYFNAWREELTATGYLHNHERLWFASVWIFTLKLPWELGARFFLDQLLDGDPASNTLSWRWVAGLQTPGKHYLARADNIAKYTRGQWSPKPGELDVSARPLRDDGLARTSAVTPALGPDAGDVRPRAVLLHDEDCGPLPATGRVSLLFGIWSRRGRTIRPASWWRLGGRRVCRCRQPRSHRDARPQPRRRCRMVPVERGGRGVGLPSPGSSPRRWLNLALLARAPNGFFPFWEAARIPLHTLHDSP